MSTTYEIKKLKDNEYVFDTQFGLSYSMELKKSNASYQLTNGKTKYIDIFKFSIFDKDYPIESDYMIRNTILAFLLNYFKNNNNDGILFYINNEFENNNFSRRAKSRMKLFRRLLRIANKVEKTDHIFLTNEHFILDHQKYEMDYIGIIMKSTSVNFNNIVRAFNKFCHENSYQKSV